MAGTRACFLSTDNRVSQNAYVTPSVDVEFFQKTVCREDAGGKLLKNSMVEVITSPVLPGKIDEVTTPGKLNIENAFKSTSLHMNKFADRRAALTQQMPQVDTPQKSNVTLATHKEQGQGTQGGDTPTPLSQSSAQSRSLIINQNTLRPKNRNQGQRRLDIRYRTMWQRQRTEDSQHSAVPNPATHSRNSTINFDRYVINGDGVLLPQKTHVSANLSRSDTEVGRFHPIEHAVFPTRPHRNPNRAGRFMFTSNSAKEN